VDALKVAAQARLGELAEKARELEGRREESTALVKSAAAAVDQAHASLEERRAKVEAASHDEARLGEVLAGVEFARPCLNRCLSARKDCLEARALS